MSRESSNADWKQQVREASNKSKAKKFKKLSNAWRHFGMKEDVKEEAAATKKFLCGLGGCRERFETKTNLMRHQKCQHSFSVVKKTVVKQRDREKHRETLKVISKKNCQRIPKSKWPALIRSYDEAFDKIKWAVENGITTSNPYRLVNDWKKILAKESEVPE